MAEVPTPDPRDPSPAPWVLIVDDDTHVLTLVKDCLDLEGIAVVATPDGAAALAALSAEPSPALILLDLLMDGVGGAAFARAYHARPAPHAPIVLFTAAVPLPEGATVETLGAVELFPKPFEIDALAALVRRYVQP